MLDFIQRNTRRALDAFSSPFQQHEQTPFGRSRHERDKMTDARRGKGCFLDESETDRKQQWHEELIGAGSSGPNRSHNPAAKDEKASPVSGSSGSACGFSAVALNVCSASSPAAPVYPQVATDERKTTCPHKRRAPIGGPSRRAKRTRPRPRPEEVGSDGADDHLHEDDSDYGGENSWAKLMVRHEISYDLCPDIVERKLKRVARKVRAVIDEAAMGMRDGRGGVDREEQEQEQRETYGVESGVADHETEQETVAVTEGEEYEMQGEEEEEEGTQNTKSWRDREAASQSPVRETQQSFETENGASVSLNSDNVGAWHHAFDNVSSAIDLASDDETDAVMRDGECIDRDDSAWDWRDCGVEDEDQVPELPGVFHDRIGSVLEKWAKDDTVMQKRAKVKPFRDGHVWVLETEEVNEMQTSCRYLDVNSTTHAGHGSLITSNNDASQPKSRYHTDRDGIIWGLENWGQRDERPTVEQPKVMDIEVDAES